MLKVTAANAIDQAAESGCLSLQANEIRRRLSEKVVACPVFS